MGGGGMGGGGMAGGMAGLGGMLPAMSTLGYGPRVVSKTLPIDPNDTSSFSINIPQVYLYHTNTPTASLHVHAHVHALTALRARTPLHPPTHTYRRVPRPSSSKQ